MFAGHVIAGACVSCTVTVNEQLGIGLPSGSWRMMSSSHVTVVVPTGKNEPEAGEHTIGQHEPVVVGAA